MNPIRQSLSLPIVLSMALACLSANPVSAQDAPDYGGRLFGDLGRGSLYQRGIDLEIVHKLDLVTQLTQGNNRGRLYALNNLDIKFNLDGGRLFGSDATRGHVHLLGNQGDKPALEQNRLPHGLDNIEVPEGADTFKVYQAWLEHDVHDDLSVKVGLWDLNSEFYVTESSGLFIHPTYGIGAEFAGTGRNGPSIFPTTSLALRLHWHPAPQWALQAAVLDAVPGDPSNAKGTHIQLNSGDGNLQILEADWFAGSPDDADGKLGMGLWRYSHRFDDVLELDAQGDPLQQRSQGLYLIGEYRLARRARGDTWGFLRWGRNDGNTIQFDSSWSAGLVWTGLLPGRPEDQFGITLSRENNSVKWRAAQLNPVDHEQALELAYRGAFNSWLTLQPFVQYLMNHGNDPGQNQSWWLGLRLEMNL